MQISRRGCVLLLSVHLPDEERAKLVNKAEIVYQDWIKRTEEKGLPGKEVFDYFMAKRKEIAGY